MKRPVAVHLLDAFAALSPHPDFSVGCCCQDEDRCHRSVLGRILERHGAKVVQ